MPPLKVTEGWSWDEEIPVPEETIQYVDQGVIDMLPRGTKVTGISPSGASYWVRTAKIDAVDENGKETPFFIKVGQNEEGKRMASAEYHYMTGIHQIMPDLIAEPIGWGAYQDIPNTHFFVVRFKELTGKLPQVADFPKLLAEMHKRSARSEYMFGWPTPLFGCYKPRWYPWTDSWEDCFTQALVKDFGVDVEVHGPNQEYEALQKKLFDKVIPRLLRPLETEGRRVTPVLVHGDLWDGNVSVDANTGKPVMFDAVCVYAHNEFDMASWWTPRQKMTGAYIEEYVKHYHKAEPVEDFADRGRLYSLSFDLHASTMYPGNLRRRNLVIDSMRYLIDKYPGGYEAYIAEKLALDDTKERSVPDVSASSVSFL